MCNPLFSPLRLPGLLSACLPLLAGRLTALVAQGLPAGVPWPPLCLGLLAAGLPLLALFLTWNPWVLPGVVLVALCLLTAAALFCLPPAAAPLP